MLDNLRKVFYIMRQQEIERVLTELCDEVEDVANDVVQELILEARNLMDRSKDNPNRMSAHRRRIANGGADGGAYE